MAGAVEVHHLPVPLGDAGLGAELGLADRRQTSRENRKNLGPPAHSSVP